MSVPYGIGHAKLLSGRPLVRIQPGVPKVAAGSPFSRVPAATFSVGKASQGSLDGGPEPRDAAPGNLLKTTSSPPQGCRWWFRLDCCQRSTGRAAAKVANATHWEVDRGPQNPRASSPRRNSSRKRKAP